MAVLIVTPTHNRLYLETLKSIFSLTYEDYDIFIPHKGYSQVDTKTNITSKYNEARDTLLSNPKYTHMLTIESDMTIPPHTIEHLMKSNADIAYGVYIFRRPPYSLSSYVVIEDGVGWSISANKDYANEFLSEGMTVDTDGVGLGCTLISREVLENVVFRIGEPIHPTENGAKTSHNDWYFALDTKDTYHCVSVGSVQCGHITEHGFTIYPSTSYDALLPVYNARFVPDGMVNQYGYVPSLDTMTIQELYAEALVTPTDMQYNLSYLYTLAKGNVVELGTRYGISTLAMLASPQVKSVTSVDIEYHQCLNRLVQSPKWEFVNSDSTLLHYEGTVDTLLVDTLHTYEQVTNELEHWLPVMNNEGTIIFHDIDMPEVRKAVEEYWTNYTVIETLQPTSPIAVIHL